MNAMNTPTLQFNYPLVAPVVTIPPVLGDVANIALHRQRVVKRKLEEPLAISDDDVANVIIAEHAVSVFSPLSLILILHFSTKRRSSRMLVEHKSPLRGLHRQLRRLWKRLWRLFKPVLRPSRKMLRPSEPMWRPSRPMWSTSPHGQTIRCRLQTPTLSCLLR